MKIVPPSAVVDAALDALAEYPDKRLIVHFLQPHQPFVGPTGQQLNDEGLLEHDEYGTNFWRHIEEGRVDEARIRRAYRENFEYVVPHVERLLDRLAGKTVVTSDHGNAFGRLGTYGHPHGVYLQGLVRVPWLEIEDERRTITKGTATEGAPNTLTNSKIGSRT
jgi:arylsulfatase A-like enzyme